MTNLLYSSPRVLFPPDRRKDLEDISHISWVIANFSSNFVAMATRVGRGRIWLTSFNSPTPKTPCQTQGSRRYLSHNVSYSQFWPKFRCHGNQGRSEVNLNDPVELAVPENHTLEPKITNLSCIQPKLWSFTSRKVGQSVGPHYSLNWCHILLFATLGT